jgi:hypothetical protein
MRLTTIGVVILLSDIAFSPVVAGVLTVATALACGVTWYALPLARRRALHRESEEQAATRRRDAA